MATPERRALRFDTTDQVLADIDSLAAAEAEGQLKCLGAWTFGQALNHLATWVDYAYEGYPLKIPFFIRWLAKPMKKQALTKPLKPGIRIPKIPGGTLAIEVVPTADALAHFRKAFDRLVRVAPDKPHPIFGPLTHDEWVAMHLRHAELHLSFLTPPR